MSVKAKKHLGQHFLTDENIARKISEAKRGDRDLYYIERVEHSNQGHYFPFMEQFSEEDRMAVIEYLKTL